MTEESDEVADDSHSRGAERHNEGDKEEDAGEEELRQFLTWLEEECSKAEGEESDEMV